jgi:CRISPR-associated protein Csx3
VSATYTCALDSIVDGVATIRIAFGVPATNDRIVPDAISALDALGLQGGRGIRFDGPARLPVAMALAHAVAHRFGFVAMRDPKLGKFVVAISHDPAVRPGDLLE